MKKRKRDRQKDTTKYLIINQHWTKPCCYYEEIGHENSIYYFDKEEYEFIQKRELSDDKIAEFENQLGKRYIQLFQFVKESQYKSLVKLLNKPYVTAFFNEAINEDDAYARYSWFLDWNCLYNEEYYREYLVVSKMMIEWCEKNDIRYKFIPFSQPDKYVYADEKMLKAKDWSIPRNYKYTPEL